jgi:hypothetical protein
MPSRRLTSTGTAALVLHLAAPPLVAQRFRSTNRSASADTLLHRQILGHRHLRLLYLVVQQ